MGTVLKYPARPVASRVQEPPRFRNEPEVSQLSYNIPTRSGLAGLALVALAAVTAFNLSDQAREAAYDLERVLENPVIESCDSLQRAIVDVQRRGGEAKDIQGDIEKLLGSFIAKECNKKPDRNSDAAHALGMNTVREVAIARITDPNVLFRLATDPEENLAIRQCAIEGVAEYLRQVGDRLGELRRQ